ncbi:hypothetical protein GGI04_004855 [Coemansia thaxteri]|uniref:NADH dehydrogenase [ubiquinone] 1 alpha subcomplex subunit 7 n=1 Tax=Coemansia thaxteri TaxID=2663907 RepID=A0A9W8EG66_9FUNG|nr:hypothetical protein GGI04_004855 [Coemansia thaxteri]KAJ1999438.1 hypothetical protein H4R26_005066 [Coemansia thaxteri]KAJ2470540.1 hypothetical protein GGI02_002860 [Coemansia sp. RSA 2322]
MFRRLWNAVGSRLWLSDYKDSMIPRTTFRSPAPASQPEYKRSVTAASDLFNNPYYKRDVRRNYPRTDVYTQPDVARLLLQAAGTAEAVLSPPPPAAAGATAAAGAAAPAADGATAPAASAVQTSAVQVRDVVEALAKLQSPVYSPSNMPPVPGTAYKYKLSPEQHAEGPGEYYPSYRVY